MLAAVSHQGGYPMKYAVLFTATAALALAACNKSEETVLADTDAATDTATVSASEAAAQESGAASANTAAFTAGEAPSKEFMVGIWGEGDACELPIDFQADGTIKDGPFPKWSLENGELSLEGAPQKMKLKVVDEKTMESQIEGKSHTLKRC
jgi:hypothetical protein